MPDDIRQIPMFHGPEGDEGSPRERLLLHLLEDVVGVAKSLAELNRDLAHVVESPAARRNGLAVATPEPDKAYVPQDREYRHWPTFRSAFMRLERAARRQKQLPQSVMVTPQMVQEAGGPHPRTVERILEKTYGLPRRCWPPSTWPDTPPINP